MEVAREAGFSDRDQVILREEITVLKFHNISDITKLDGKQIKQGIVDGTLEDRTSRYRFPRLLPWADAHSRIMQKLIHRITVGTKRLITQLEEFDPTVQPPRKELFYIDPTPTRLVDMRGRTTVEHKIASAPLPHRSHLRQIGRHAGPHNC
jgi:hypothetical protein